MERLIRVCCTKWLAVERCTEKGSLSLLSLMTLPPIMRTHSINHAGTWDNPFNTLGMLGTSFDGVTVSGPCGINCSNEKGNIHARSSRSEVVDGIHVSFGWRSDASV